MAVEQFWIQIGAAGAAAATAEQILHVVSENMSDAHDIVSSTDQVAELCAVLERFQPADVCMCKTVLAFIFHAVWERSLSHVSNDAVGSIVRTMALFKTDVSVQLLGIRLLGLFPEQTLKLSAIGIITSAMLDDSNARFQEVGCWSLCAIAMCGRKFRDAIRASNGVQALVSSQLTELAERYKTISCLAADGAIFQTQLGGVMKTIVCILSTPTYRLPEFIIVVLNALRNLVIFHADNMALFLDLGGIQALEVLRGTPPLFPTISIALCEILACIGQAGDIPSLSRTLMQYCLRNASMYANARLADARLHPSLYITDTYLTAIAYSKLIGNDTIDPIMRPMLGLVVPWNYDMHHRFPLEIRRQIAAVLVLARSDNARTRAMFPRLTSTVLNRLLGTLAWMAYGC